ncbi:1-phosphofructokinase [Vibrio rarus]|uniref:1-phosphofructokinase n=1 Tax=Vibrio rarus TaxID=413403 RepID=UPI0021C39827|nr:1-phosphofructokinase [Vibrio rarus]
MHTNKVVTVTLNPALDLSGSLTHVTLGTVNAVDSATLHAAGKGINVAQVLSELGADVTVTGFLGQNNAQLFEQLFQNIQGQDKFIRVHGNNRTNVKLIEDNGTVSDINFPGISVTEDDIQRLEITLFELAQHHDYFVIAGSLPPGVSAQRCASWITALQQQNKKVIFDSSNAALLAGIQAKPWMIKPNDDELSNYIGHPLTTPLHCQQVAQQVMAMGVDNVVVSMGEHGVIWQNNQQCLIAQPPKVPIISTVGAGDTLVAGLCWGHMQNMSQQRTLQLATALSALAVTQVGVGTPTRPAQLQHMIKQVSVTVFP